MKLFVQNTIYGLVPCDDNDYEIKRKLKHGQVYQVEIKKARNYDFHKKYFALINCTYHFLNEKQIEFYGTVEQFRKKTECAAGHCELGYDLQGIEVIFTKSISFEKMDELQFQDLYRSVREVIWKHILNGNITEEQFEKELKNF